MLVVNEDKKQDKKIPKGFSRDWIFLYEKVFLLALSYFFYRSCTWGEFQLVSSIK
jgi:hypothetical protein